MNDSEKQRLQDATKAVENMRAQANNFIGNNGKLAADSFKKYAKDPITPADTKKNIEKNVLPRLEKAASAAKKAEATCLKLYNLSIDKKELDACADAKAFHDKHAKLVEDARAFHEAARTYATGLVLDAGEATKFGKDMTNISKCLFICSSDVPVKVTMNAAEQFELYFKDFQAKWNALASAAPAPARPSSAAPARPSSAAPSAAPARPSSAAPPKK